jgi:hypothetical protein
VVDGEAGGARSALVCLLTMLDCLLVVKFVNGIYIFESRRVFGDEMLDYIGYFIWEKIVSTLKYSIKLITNYLDYLNMD